MNFSRSRSLLLAAFAVCLPATQAWANTIAVNNGSFETHGTLGSACAGTDCAYSFDPIPGWTTPTSAGIFQPGNPSNTVYFNSIPDGTAVGFNSGPNALAQTVGAKVIAGVTYTMTVEVGHRKDEGPYAPNVDVMLGNGDVFVATGPGDPGLGEWATYTVTFTGTAQEAGSSMTIQLFDDGGQGDFDDVNFVDNSVVPEPGSLSLLAIGMSGLGATGLFKRKNASR